MTPGTPARLAFPARVRFPDLHTRTGTVEATDGGWVAVRFGGMRAWLKREEVTG